MTRVIRRGDIVDMLERSDECLVLTPHGCLRLSATATATVRYLQRPREFSEIEAHLTGLFGPAPDGAVEQIIADLTAAGVITDLE